ncbi:E3 ubiquitin-protein ligase [Canna indica]|uniref:E3 ubiquitin-protein ligase n=1 Tax=Canna indica TaxID=4628 RepID=A0AAQ3KY03_9LILI|nr:E3 ubiquitin-protein ligase [Canna indica]
MASPPASPPPPPSLRPLKNLPSGVDSSRSDGSSSISLSPSLLIISAIIAFVFVASASIHLLLRFLSSRRRSSSVAAAPPLPPLLQLRRSDSSSAAAVAAAADAGLSDKEKEALIESLPLFSLASSLAALPKSSPDCAVCLCPFRPYDVLRLLPACRHAFHSRCVDPWLCSSPSCPLCRTSIALPALPLPPPPPSLPPPALGTNADATRSSSFRVEIGSVSRRRTPAEVEQAGNPPQHQRTYSLGSSFEYVVDEEVDAVVARIRRRTEKEDKRDGAVAESAASAAVAAPPVAEAVGGGGRGWLREYVDRLASSASSSFSSFRFSGRWSHRYDAGVPRYSWDLEGSARREAEEGGYYGFYRWLIGA